MFRSKTLISVLSLFISLVLVVCCASADGYSSGRVSADAPVSGLASETVSFTVTSYGSSRLTLVMYPGTASLLRSGRSTTDAGRYGAFLVSCGNKLISWYNREGNYPVAEGVNQYVNRDTLVMNFNTAGTYDVTVTPFTAEQLNSLWGNNWFVGWEEYPVWECSAASNCIVGNIVTSGTDDSNVIDFGEPDGSYQVSVRYEDAAGKLLDYETRTVTSSGYIKPKTLTGYTLISDASRYISVSGGICTPSVVTFVYQKKAVGAQLQILCKDQNGKLLDSETRTVTENTFITPREISGYTAPGGRYVTYLASRNTCSPASVTFTYTKKAASAALDILYVDQNGKLLDSETRKITATTTVSGKEIAGYSLVTGSRTVKYNSNGTCSPASVTFTYSKNPTYATLNIRYVDTNGTILDTASKKITADTTVSGKEIAGYTLVTDSRYVTYLGNGTCSPATVTFTYSKKATYAILNIRYVDTDGDILDTASKKITADTTVSGKAIDGYRLTTGSRYITYLGSGTCSPETVTFVYEPVETEANVQVRCYDENGDLIKKYTQQLMESGYVSPRNIDGYTCTSSKKYIDVTRGIADPDSVSFYYQPNAKSAQLVIEYKDEGGLMLDREERTLSSSGKVSGKQIAGYTLLTGEQYVDVDTKNGTCIPASVTFTYAKNKTGSVNVTYQDNDGNVLGGDNVAVTQSGNVAGKRIPGYSLITGPQNVKLDPRTGACSPASLTFVYRAAGSASDKATSASMIMEQARTPVKAYWENKQNKQVELSFDFFNALKDGNPSTAWKNTYWKVCKESEAPELTLTYDNETVSYIWFRAGDYSGDKKKYLSSARPSGLIVKVYCDSGTVTKQFQLDDNWQCGIEGWQCIDLGQDCIGTTKVTFNITSNVNGRDYTYEMYISDVVAN